MIAAELLKLRGQRWALLTALALATGPVAAGILLRGTGGDSWSIVRHALAFCSLSALVIGATLGGADRQAGVLRDLWLTGRPRVALLASRLRACVLVCAGAGTLTVAVAALLAKAAGISGAEATTAQVWLFVVIVFVVEGLLAGALATLTGPTPALVALVGIRLIVAPLSQSTERLAFLRPLLPANATDRLDPTRAGSRTAEIGDYMGLSPVLAGVVLVAWCAGMIALAATVERRRPG